MSKLRGARNGFKKIDLKKWDEPAPIRILKVDSKPEKAARYTIATVKLRQARDKIKEHPELSMLYARSRLRRLTNFESARALELLKEIV